MLNLYSIKIYLHSFKKLILPIRGHSNTFANKSKNHRLFFDVVGNFNRIEIEDCRIHNSQIRIRGNNNRLYIERGCYLKNTKIYIEDNNCEVRIGKQSTIEGAEFDVKEDFSKLTIAENCMLSQDIYITTSDSHSILGSEEKLRKNFGKSVLVQSNVWLGRDVKILKGSNVGTHTIVAAGSIVVGELDANSIYAGIPARKIEDNVCWLRERL